MNAKSKLFLIVGLGLAMMRSVMADPTAFDLAKKGNDYVGVQSKDKLVRIHSDKSVANLTPNIWHVLYLDPDSTFKTVEVKFGGGEKMDVSHPVRPFQLPGDAPAVLDKSKLKVDSDKALNIATSQPLLKSLTLKASQMSLEYTDGAPVWKIQLWAAKLKNPNSNANVGTVSISATDGSVIKSDLHPASVD